MRYYFVFLLVLWVWAILPQAEVNPFLANRLKYCSQLFNTLFTVFFTFKKYSSVFFLPSIRTRDLIGLEIVSL